MEIKKYISDWSERYRSDLVENILPFWMTHGLDRVHGGVYTCLDRDGTLMDTTKSVWFQGRFGYIAAAAYNRIEKRQEWLDASRSCIDFIERHCIDQKDGHMYFEVMADGTPLRKRRYVFSESFAALAMAEYSIATGDIKWAERALDIFHHIRHMLDTPGFLAPKFEPVLEARGHSITMILINTGSRIRAAFGDNAPAELTDSITTAIDEIERYFVHPEFKALLEMVGPEGEFIDTMAGRTINPGHCIE
ncbi:MAG: AGE family epimerase/isomerase, partial [Muribaculaceae bacterium]|nr:AGE family epimerase/isomerase [Muribaculaceae bacterium]